MQINVSFDQDVTKLPAGFATAVQAAVQFLENTYTNPITFNLHVGYGERDGHALGASSLGESVYNVHSYTYAQIETAMTNHAQSADQKAAVASLPASDPVAGSHTWWMTDVEAKALGLIANTTTLDAHVGFADTSHFTFDYNRSDGITAGQYDFFGTVVHEITEVMGRELGVGQQLINNTNTYYPLDLFHYVDIPPEAYLGRAASSPGTTAGPLAAQEAATASGSLIGDGPGTVAGSTDVASLAPGSVLPNVGILYDWHVHDFSRGGYFSFDGGTTKLTEFNPLSSGDAGDWAPSAGNDSFLNVSHPGVINNVTAADLSLMDVLGYDRAPISHLPVDEIANAVQSGYLAITRTHLPLDQATTLANSIDSGGHTESQYISDLLAQVADTTIPAVAVEASMYGAVGTSDEITLLATHFLPGQVHNAISSGLDPLVYASEALGLAFAFGNENGSTSFAAAFGPAHTGIPSSTAGDAAFAAAAASTIFGSASTDNLVNAMESWVANWKAFYSSHGVSGIYDPSAAQIDLAARGAAWGDAVGVALGNDLGPLKGQVTNFLIDAAQGTAVYSASLASQPGHADAAIGSLGSADATVHLTGIAAHVDHLVA
jgi:hypothetical protein